MAILICDDELRFIFFPFTTSSGVPCVDAIVTLSIPLYRITGQFKPRLIDEQWFSFVCFYLTTTLWKSLTPLDPATFNIMPHPKKEYTEKNGTSTYSRVSEG